MILCVGVVALHNYRTKPLFTGRTTLMEKTGMSKEGVPLYQEQYTQLDLQLRLSNLGTIATSQKVLQNAAETLGDLNIQTTPLEILQATKVQPVRDTNILAVEVTLQNPEEAKVAADVLSAEFKKVYAELNNEAVRQSKEFIEAQIGLTKRKMLKAQDDLRKFKEQNEIVELSSQGTAAINRLSQAKSTLNSIQAQRKAAEARVAKINSEMKSLPDWHTVSTSTSRNPIWQKLTDELVTLETQKASMLAGGPGQSRRGPNHPDVQFVERRIAEVKKELADTQVEIVSGKSDALNGIKQGTVSSWINSKVEEVSAVAQEQVAEASLEEARAELASLPAIEAKLAELQTDVRAASDTYGLMRAKLDEAKIKEEQAKNEVTLKTVDPAYVYPVNQKRAIKLILALLFSPLLGIGVAFLLHYTDNTIKTANEAEKLLGVPVMAAVPNSRAHSLPRQSCPEIVDVAYQMLTSGLWIENQNSDVNSVVVVSAEPDCGRSVTASNMAVALAKEGARVVLVDADLRQPTQHLIFGIDNKVGLTNLLSGAANIEDCLVTTKVQGLLLMPSGPVPDNPVKLLRSQEMKNFADEISELADFVVFDTPAGVAFPDPILIASQVGHAVIVHSAGRVPRGSEAEFKAKLESIGVRLLGAVLNKVKREDSSGYFHYYRSYSSIGIGPTPGKKKAIANGRGRV